MIKLICGPLDNVILVGLFYIHLSSCVDTYPLYRGAFYVKASGLSSLYRGFRFIEVRCFMALFHTFYFNFAGAEECLFFTSRILLNGGSFSFREQNVGSDTLLKFRKRNSSQKNANTDGNGLF